MADNLIAPLAQTPLIGGMRVVLESLDPDTGAAVTGVDISQVTISGVPLAIGSAGGGDQFIETGQPILIPGAGA